MNSSMLGVCPGRSLESLGRHGTRSWLGVFEQPFRRFCIQVVTTNVRVLRYSYQINNQVILKI